MLNWLFPKPKKDVFSQLEALLVEAIPPAVKGAKVADLVYCLRVYYDGTDSPPMQFATPRVRLTKEKLRKERVAEKGKDAPYYLWCADETDLPDHGFQICLNKAEIKVRCLEIYRLIGVDESKNLALLRVTMQRVAKALNATDDFVVFPADGSHTYCDDMGDMRASVPAARLELLRERGLLDR